MPFLNSIRIINRSDRSMRGQPGEPAGNHGAASRSVGELIDAQTPKGREADSACRPKPRDFEA